jgi:hypothetical protein
LKEKEGIFFCLTHFPTLANKGAGKKEELKKIDKK